MVKQHDLGVIDDYTLWQRAYRNDLAGFMTDCIRWDYGDKPTPYQITIARHLLENDRACIRSPHGAGKTALMAQSVLWFALTRDGVFDWKAITTASVHRQLTVYLWPEIHKWASRIRWDRIGRAPFNSNELQVRGLKLKTGAASAVASNKSELIEGAHAQELFYLLDEAKLIPAKTWDAVEGAFSTAGSDTKQRAMALATSTPSEELSGRFYDIHSKRATYSDWWVYHITRAEAIASGQMSEEWVKGREKSWGKGTEIFCAKVDGDFPKTGGRGIIPLSWIELSNDRWEAMKDQYDTKRLTRIAMDPADGGEDKSMLGYMTDNFIHPIDDITQPDHNATMALVGEIVNVARHNKETLITVDTIGVGSGCASRLLELEYNCEPFIASERTDVSDDSEIVKFANKRAASWFVLRDRLNPEGDPNTRLALPPDDELTEELIAPRRKLFSDGRLGVEPKDDIKERIGRSTNKADVVAMLAYPFEAGLSFIDSI